mmetsp:Transcript_46129/g.86036  ORF Transcript_46129/g.86036 Transcript_46129/m.86036 type:complete len:257 (-) Transcript_46129:10-780(-)
MGSVITSATDGSAPVPCATGRASHSFPLRVSVEAARAAAAAAMGSAVPTSVVGYTTSLTKEAGAASVRLQFKTTARSNLSSAPASCATISLRSEGRLGFLSGIASFIRRDDLVLLEAVVFGRPNEPLQELMPLDEPVLQSLYRQGATVDLRILRSLPFEPAPEVSEDSETDGELEPSQEPEASEAALEAAPTRSARAEWLVERLLLLASSLESQFGASRHDSEATYEGCELDGEGVVSWLRDAGLQITGNMFFETR